MCDRVSNLLNYFFYFFFFFFNDTATTEIYTLSLHDALPISPRILKAPIGVWFSCLTQSSAPTRRDNNGQQYCGVGGTTRRTSAAALSNVARSIMTQTFGRFFRARSSYDASASLYCRSNSRNRLSKSVTSTART